MRLGEVPRARSVGGNPAAPLAAAEGCMLRRAAPRRHPYGCMLRRAAPRPNEEEMRRGEERVGAPLEGRRSLCFEVTVFCFLFSLAVWRASQGSSGDFLFSEAVVWAVAG